MDYEEFILSKTQAGEDHGFTPNFLPSYLFDFQQALVEWSVKKGRAALFTDCGTGKGPMALVWAQNMVNHTDKPALILTPLAVSYQLEREAEKFGINARVSRDGIIHKNITITNYEKLHLFSYHDFSAVVCDESAVLKNFSAARRKDITVFMRKIPYRLLCSATPAPNDYNELGTSSEALGYLGYMDMLARFFKNDLNNCAARHRNQALKFRLKGHAELPFWRWVCSWSRAMRKPSDLGFDDAQFILPELIVNEHIMEVDTPPPGKLFSLPSVGLFEQREERRRTITERCRWMANIVNPTGQPALIWCHLNPEGDMLEKLIPDSVQISGRDSDEQHESKLLAFIRGDVRVLVTKPKIGAWGLNLQHCNHIGYFPDHSYEQYYQGIRRCWRFGQQRPVTVDIITTVGEQEILQNLQRKADQADKMFTTLVGLMNDALHIERSHEFTQKEEVIPWLSTISL